MAKAARAKPVSNVRMFPIKCLPWWGRGGTDPEGGEDQKSSLQKLNLFSAAVKLAPSKSDFWWGGGRKERTEGGIGGNEKFVWFGVFVLPHLPNRGQGERN